MAAVESSTSFKISSRHHRKKTKKHKTPLPTSLQVKVNQTTNDINYADDLLKKSIRFIFIAGTVLSCIMSISGRVKTINPVFMPLMDREIAPINDSFYPL